MKTSKVSGDPSSSQAKGEAIRREGGAPKLMPGSRLGRGEGGLTDEEYLVLNIPKRCIDNSIEDNFHSISLRELIILDRPWNGSHTERGSMNLH